MEQWTTVFEGPVGGRSVEVRIYGDREAYQVRTTLAKPFADSSIPLTRDAGSRIDIDAENLAEVRRELIENGFSERDAAEICARANVEDELRRFSFEHLGRRVEASGRFGDGRFSVLVFAKGATRMTGAPGSGQPSGATLGKPIIATNLVALRAKLSEAFPGHTELMQF